MTDWSLLDVQIAMTSALAAMSCALPGTFLVLRKQSMLGDALSHTVLPGIVMTVLVAQALRAAGWMTEAGATSHFLLFGGAVLSGVLTALLTETVHRWGRVEESAALGVVYTSLFAFGLLLIRLMADSVHLDADCVLFGAVETSVLDTWGDTFLPTAAVVNAGLLAINGLIVCLFLKELRVTTFDPALAASLGIRPSVVTYLLMSVTAVTIVAAFESVGLILVVTMLVTPASTALLFSDRFSRVVVLSVLIAGIAAVIGHLFAVTLPPLLFQPLGFANVRDSSTAGMTALVCGLIFGIAFLFGQRRGLVTQWYRHARLSFRIACEDLLGLLYRSAEAEQAVRHADLLLHDHPRFLAPILRRVALWHLQRSGLVTIGTIGYGLSDAGRVTAERLVRSHRLWESYMARYFPLADDHLHQAAARVEHFLDEHLLAEIDSVLDRPDADPHGRSIPNPGDAPPGR